MPETVRWSSVQVECSCISQQLLASIQNENLRGFLKCDPGTIRM